jgi:hypothetical protein
MQHAGTTLRKIFRQTVGRDGGSAPVLAWPLACGMKIADRTEALSFAEGILTVAVLDETWRRQLQSFRLQYLAALNGISSEKVDRIEFVVVTSKT